MPDWMRKKVESLNNKNPIDPSVYMLTGSYYLSLQNVVLKLLSKSWRCIKSFKYDRHESATTFAAYQSNATNDVASKSVPNEQPILRRYTERAQLGKSTSRSASAQYGAATQCASFNDE